ncbi:uncharacterized protein FIESC28_01990 [Fusarium coffeatum]|uniref:Uncharacterized protein n=1 Tax=Fusarium coffeatum TaxID=231269 RepID=A0A366S9G3_9HYPO|nr:uncharacterized protein FIESC28_01990 [Fusarium coffeatum]RBR25255.1 hypothetical protein FIESC28_01990 [Fusarium coffeatum]
MAVGNLSGVALAAHGSCTDASTAKLDTNAVDAPAIQQQDAFDAKDGLSIKSLWAISISSLCESDRTMFQIDNETDQLRILGDIIRIIENTLEKKRKTGLVRPNTLCFALGGRQSSPLLKSLCMRLIHRVNISWLCLNASAVSSAILEGLEVVIRVISRNNVIEATYRREESVDLRTDFETGLDKLYKLVLDFLCSAKKHYARSSSGKWLFGHTLPSRMTHEDNCQKRIVTKLLSSGMDLNTADELGRSALEFAVNELRDNRFDRRRVKGELESRFEMLSTLLRHGADVSKLTEECHVITTEIVERGRLDLLLRFEVGGCHIFPQQQGLSSALSIAVRKRHVDMVGHIIDTQKPGDTKIDRVLGSLGGSGSSAQEEDQVQIARLLLAARSSRLVTMLPFPLNRAASNKHFLLYRTLIAEADHSQESYIKMLKDTVRTRGKGGEYIPAIWRQVGSRPDKLFIYNSAITAFTQNVTSSYTSNFSLLHMLLQGADSNIRGRSGESLLYHTAIFKVKKRE